MSNDVLAVLTKQYETAWKLTDIHLQGLTTEECLWRPAVRGLHVHKGADGKWTADWPEHEGYDLGPSSIGWLTWHLGFWWSMVLDHSFGAGGLSREDVAWPGGADELRERIYELEADWRNRLGELSDDYLQSTALTRWPIQDRPFRDVVAWLNIELAKNAAEIGYARFLYAVSTHSIS